MLRCPSAQQLEPVPHTASAGKEDFMLQAQTATGTYITSSRAHSPPGNTWKSNTDKQFKILLDDQYQNPISLREEIQATYTG